MTTPFDHPVQRPVRKVDGRDMPPPLKPGWIEEIVGRVATECRVCGATMAAHRYGWPLTVCPKCYPDEVYEGVR